MRFVLFTTMMLVLSLALLSNCGSKSPQTDVVPGQDSTLVTASADSLPSGMDQSALDERYPLKGDSLALADTTLAYGRAGALYLGMPVDSVYIAYGREQIRKEDRRLDDAASPALGISLPGGTEDNPSLVAEVRDNTVRRIRVYDPRFRTPKGMGQGSTFGDLREQYQVGQVAERDGDVIAVVNEPGIYFALDTSEIPRDFYQTRDKSLIPDSAKVIFLFVWGKISSVR